MELYQDGNLIETLILTANQTNWVIELPALADGNTYQYTARIVDVAGNTGNLSSVFNIKVDTTAPTASVNITSYVDNEGIHQGSFGSDTTTDDQTPVLKGTLNGSLNAGEVIQIFDRDNPTVAVGIAIIDGPTDWHFQLPTLGQGTHNYYAVVVDLAGNRGALSTDFDIVVDLTAPTQTTTIISFTDNVGVYTGDFLSGTQTDDTTLVLNDTIDNGQAVDANDTVLIYQGSTLLGAATLNVARTAWTYALSGLNNADNLSYTAVIVDTAGNLGTTSAAFQIIVDTAKPTVTATIASYYDDVAPTTGVFGNNSITNDQTPTLSGSVNGTLNATDKVAIFENGNIIGYATLFGNNWIYQLPTLADQASHTFIARVDAAGNLSDPSASFTINVDTTAVAVGIAIAYYQDDSHTGAPVNKVSGTETKDTTPLLTGNLGAELQTGDRIDIYQVDTVANTSTLVGTVSTVVGTIWIYQLPALTDGSYSYRADLVNSLGTTTSSSSVFNLTVDTIAPTTQATITVYNDTVPLLTGDFGTGTSTNDSHALLKGALSAALQPGEALHIHDSNGNLVGTASVTGTSWELALTSTLTSDGIYTFNAQVVDAAGNEGPVSNAFTLTLDTSAPKQTVAITAYTDDVGVKKGDYLSGSYTDDTQPVLKGTLSSALGSGEVLSVYEGSTLVGTATVTGLNWTLAITTLGLSQGSHSFTARVEDAAGNQGALSNSFNLIVDTIATSQTATIDAYIDDVGTLESKGSGTTTDDTMPTLRGTVTSGVQAGCTINVYQNGVLVSSVELIAGQTAWTYTPSTALAFGVITMLLKWPIKLETKAHRLQTLI